MSNIRVDVSYTIQDGSELVFRSPVDCSAITGMIVYYPGSDGNITSKVFALADAHGNNVGDIDHLFAENVVVKVILDVTTGMAFVQNADTNAYLEGHIQNKENPHGVTASQVGARPNTWFPSIAEIGAAPAGYGLNNDFVTVNNTAALDSYFTCGWVRFINTVTDDLLMGYRTAIIRVDSYSNSTGNELLFQTAYLFSGAEQSVGKIQRFCTKGSWQPWEWVNPLMAIGTEYRTTERYMGKPVYARLVNLGAMPNATSKTHQSLAIGVDNIVYVGFTYKKSDVRYFNNPDITWYVSCYNNPYIVVTTTKDMSAYTGYLLIKYTKTAD